MKRFHLWRSLCLLALLFLCLFQIPSLAEELHPYTEVRSSYKETYWQEFVYSDKFFLTDSTAGVNPEIAKVSVSLAAGAYRPNDINSMLYQMGFSYDNFQFYERNINYNDLVAYTIGTKDIPGTTKTAVIVAIRGSAQNAEWFSNFNVGASRSDDADLFDPGDHLGFHQAASAVWDSTTSVLSTIGYEDRIVLVTGHSRGGAVANIVSAWLNESHIVPEDQLFGYTYACPNVSKNVEKDPYQNIHNFNITGDMVPAVPLRSWGYDRHGITHEITAPQKMYQTIVGREYTGASVTSHYERAFSALAATAEDLDDPLRQFMLMSVAYIMGGSADVSMEELTIKYLTDNSAFLAKMYLEKVILREFDDVQEAFEAGAEMGRATLKLIYQLQAETEGMTPEEFEEHREKNIDAYNEIMGATGVVIETLGDFPVAISVLLNAIQYADEAGEIAGMFIFQKEDTGSGSLGSTMQSIMDAHLEPVYVCYVNQEYYGYLGGIHKTRKVTLPEGVLTVGPRCFEGSAFTGFNGGSVEYIPGYSFANANQMETLLIPDTIAYIGEKAFLGNYGLKQITMPIECSGFNLFSSCPNVQTIEYTAQSDGVMPIRGDHEYDNHHYKYTLEYACRDSVEKIVYHEGVTEIANFANVHTNASKLTEISLPSTLQKIGNNAFRNTALPSLTLPQNLESIGDHAFADCFAMTSVTIPASVTTIHGSAFRNCDALTEITLHNAVIGNECFMECDGLETLVIPNNITWIGSNAFSSCKGLKTITLPIEQSGVKIFEGCSNVQTIEYTAQSDGVMPNRGDHEYDNHHYKYALEFACRSTLEKIVYHEGVTEIAAFAAFPGDNFNGSRLSEITLPSTLQKIGHHAFCGTALPSPMLPENVETIDSYAFAGCASMTSVTIPASVVSMGSGVFMNCDALTDITLKNSIIGPECFSNCDALETLVIPNAIISIGRNAFQSCLGLKHITLPIEQSGVKIFEGCSNVQTIEYTAQSTGVMPNRGDHQYDDHHYKYALEFACRSTLEKIVYHEGVTEIAAFAAFPGDNFNGSRLSEIALPSTLRKIGHHAFCGTALPSPMLPENVETIDSYAFAGCASMTSVTIPASVVSMGSGVFMNCDALTDITLKNSIIGSECFSNCDALETLVIPNAIISIGRNAFQSCLGLKHITLPIEQSGVKIFEGCSNVQTIEYTAQSDGVMPIRRDGEYDEEHYKYALEFACRSTLEKVVYHEGVTEIAAFAAFPGDNFNGSRLSEITLPSTLQKIGHHAFCGTALPSPMLPENVKTIDSYAFAGCASMTSVTIPASVVSMGSGVFMNCDALTDITLKNSIIGPECFSNCDALETLVIPNSITFIGRDAFTLCANLQEVTLPIERSGFQQFTGCQNVQTIRYTAQSDGVMHYRSDGYYDDTHYQYTLEFQCRNSLKKIVYDEGVTRIASFAHLNSSALAEVLFPSTLTAIDHHAFEGCPKLGIVVLGGKVNQVDNSAFNQPEMYVVCIEDSWAHNWASQKGYTALHCCQTPQVLMAQGLLPTCTQPGLSDGYTCESCGGELLTQQTIPATGHAVVLAASRYETTQDEEISIPFTLSCGGACGLNVYWHGFSGYNGMAQSSVIYLADTPGAGEMQLWIGEDEANASSCTLIVHASEQLKVPSSVTELGEEAFAHIAAVEVLLPENAQSIGPRAFADCANLALITIPDSVTSIAANAFEGSDGVVILCSANSFAAQYAEDTDTLWVAK